MSSQSIILNKKLIALQYFRKYYSVGYLRAIIDLTERGLTREEAEQIIIEMAEAGLLKINKMLGVIDYVYKPQKSEKQTLGKQLRIVEREEVKKEEESEKEEEEISEDVPICMNCIHYHEMRCTMKPDAIRISPMAQYPESCPFYINRYKPQTPKWTKILWG